MDVQNASEGKHDMVILKYIGNADGHGAYIEGVPATDLTQEQIDASGYTVDELLAFSPAVYALTQRAGE